MCESATCTPSTAEFLQLALWLESNDFKIQSLSNSKTSLNTILQDVIVHRGDLIVYIRALVGKIFMEGNIMVSQVYRSLGSNLCSRRDSQMAYHWSLCRFI